MGVILHPTMEVATDGEDAGTHWEILGMVPRLQPLLSNLVYSESLISRVKPFLLSKAPGNIQEELRYKHVSAAGHGFFGQATTASLKAHL